MVKVKVKKTVMQFHGDEDREFKKLGKTRAGVDPNRRFDKTQLHDSHHGQIVHRDYLAHVMRWGWAGTFSGPTVKILDVGCGQDQPLLRVLQGSISLVPERYLGVDYNKISKKRESRWATVVDRFNFVDDYKQLKKDRGYPFDLVTCFEVIEHMRKKDGVALLRNVRELMADDACFLLSTPVYGRKMAANHIHEYEVKELQDVIYRAGLDVVKRFGTFASWNDIKKVATRGELALLDELKQFYSWEVLSCFLAPKYPDASRNNAWLLKKGKT